MKKILFSDRYGLTDAVLKGHKTITRRIFKATINDLFSIKMDNLYEKNGKFNSKKIIDKYAKYKIGEVLAIAQSYFCVFVKENRTDLIDPFIRKYEKGWTNKMYVQANCMPHHIRITDISLDLLRNISDEDCINEGIQKWMGCFIVPGIIDHRKNNVCFNTPREAYAALIDRISGRGTWNNNPIVFVYKFELLE